METLVLPSTFTPQRLLTVLFGGTNVIDTLELYVYVTKPVKNGAELVPVGEARVAICDRVEPRP